MSESARIRYEIATLDGEVNRLLDHIALLRARLATVLYLESARPTLELQEEDGIAEIDGPPVPSLGRDTLPDPRTPDSILPGWR